MGNTQGGTVVAQLETEHGVLAGFGSSQSFEVVLVLWFKSMTLDRSSIQKIQHFRAKVQGVKSGKSAYIPSDESMRIQRLSQG